MRKFITYFVLGAVLSIFSFFFIKYFDRQWTLINWIIQNKSFLIFFIISVIIYFSLRWENGIKTKFLVNSLVFINFIYLCYLFLVWNIWMTRQQSLILICLLVVWGFSFYLKNIFWYIMFVLCSVWSVIILFLSMIPLYEKWPDILWFKNNFDVKILIYSDKTLDENDAIIEKDDKKLLIYNWLSSYDFKSNKKTSQIVFKSKNLYDNVFWFIVFPWGEFIELTPQSAINVYENFEIEVLAWNIWFYPESPDYFTFVDDSINSWYSISLSQNNNIVYDWYYENLKNYVKNELWWKFIKNKTLLKISKYTLNILCKLFPWKYEDNLDNLDKFLDIFDITLETSWFLKASKNINSWSWKNMLNMFGNSLKNGLENTNGIDLNPWKNKSF